MAERKSTAVQKTETKDSTNKTETTTDDTAKKEKTVKTETTTEKTEAKKTETPTAPLVQCSLEFKEIVYEPDPSHMYRLDYETHLLADDKVTVTLTPQGFLSALQLETEDKSPAVLVKLIDTAKAAIEAAALGVLETGGPSEDFTLDMTLDVTDEKALKKLNDELKTRKCELSVSLEPLSQTPPASNDRPEAPGIFFRPLLPYALQFLDSKGLLTTKIIYLPNQAPVMSLDISRSAFIKKVTSIQFENGILKQLSIQKPSEAIGFVEIPLSIAKAILSVPAEIFQVKVNLKTESNKLLEAQKNELETTKKLLDAEESLRKLRTELEEEKKGSGSQ